MRCTSVWVQWRVRVWRHNHRRRAATLNLQGISLPVISPSLSLCWIRDQTNLSLLLISLVSHFPPLCCPIMCSTVPPSFFITFCISPLLPQIFLPVLPSDHLSPHGHLSSNPALHQGSLHCPYMLTFIQQKSTGGNSLCILSDPLNLAGLQIPKSSYWGIYCRFTGRKCSYQIMQSFPLHEWCFLLKKMVYFFSEPMKIWWQGGRGISANVLF